MPAVPKPVCFIGNLLLFQPSPPPSVPAVTLRPVGEGATHSTHPNDFSTARRQSLHSLSLCPLLIFGSHVRSSCQPARSSFASFQNPTASPAAYAAPKAV